MRKNPDKIERRYAAVKLFILTVAIALSGTLSIIKYNLIPQLYFTDANKILQLMTEDRGGNFFDSFTNTAIFYSILPGGNSVFWVSLLSMIACVLIAAQVINYLGGIAKLNFVTLLLVSAYLLLASIFLAQHSKDFLVLLMVSLFLALIRKGPRGLIFFMVLAMLYSALFRQYWIIFLSFFTVLIYFSNKEVQLKKLISIVAGLLFSLAAFFEVFLGKSLNHYRYLVNDNKYEIIGIKAATKIDAILPSTNFIFEWLNALAAWAFLMFPLPLLKLLTLYHTLSFFLISLIFSIFFLAYKAANRNWDSRVSFMFILSFTAIQSIFEPDYGSFLRHFTPLLPILIYIYQQKTRLS